MRTLIALSAAAMLTGCTAHQVSPLAGAARSGQISEIRRLIKAGSTPNEGSGVNNWPPLMHAVHKEQREAVRTLLELGADPNQMAGGWNALIMAASYGDASTVRLLLNGGADPTISTHSGANALTAAISGSTDIDKFTLGKCQPDAVKAILEKAPQMRASLTAAKIKGCREVLDLLQARR